MTGFFILQELKKRSNVKLSTRRRQPPHQHQSVLGSNPCTEPGSSPFPPTPALQLVLSILLHRFPSLPPSLTPESQTASCRGNALSSPSKEQVKLLFRILCPVFMFHRICATQAADKTCLKVLGGGGIHNDVTHRKYRGWGPGEDLALHKAGSSSIGSPAVL